MLLQPKEGEGVGGWKGWGGRDGEVEKHEGEMEWHRDRGGEAKREGWRRNEGEMERGDETGDDEGMEKWRRRRAAGAGKYHGRVGWGRGKWKGVAEEAMGRWRGRGVEEERAGCEG